MLAARDTDGLKQTEAAVVACSVDAQVVPTDVTSEQQIEALFTRTMERFERLDILVNNSRISSFWMINYYNNIHLNIIRKITIGDRL